MHSGAVLGIDPLTVEVDNHPGTNQVNIVGLPDTAVKESRDRGEPLMEGTPGHQDESIAPRRSRLKELSWMSPITSLSAPHSRAVILMLFEFKGLTATKRA